MGFHVKEILDAYPNLVSLSFIIAIVLVLFLVQVGQSVFDSFFEANVRPSRWLRNLIFGKDGVEGTYIEVGIHPEDNEILSVSKVVIDLQNGNLAVSGQNFRSDGTPEGEFHSIASNYSRPSLNYVYRRTSIGDPSGIRGQTILTFGTDGRKVIKFSGGFRDSETGTMIKVDGRRLSGKKSRELLSKNDHEFAASVLEYFTDVYSHIEKSDRTARKTAYSPRIGPE